MKRLFLLHTIGVIASGIICYTDIMPLWLYIAIVILAGAALPLALLTIGYFLIALDLWMNRVRP